jgi:peptide methionine sulfoxide reductase MsrA
MSLLFRRIHKGGDLRLASIRRPIVAAIPAAAGPFYPAEDYHENYYKKNRIPCQFYRWNCGCDQRLAELWG